MAHDHRPVQAIRSRDNPLLQRLRRLAQDGAACRREGQVWVEGEHLCAAARDAGVVPLQAVLGEPAWADPALQALALRAPRVAVLPQRLFDELSALPSPRGIGFVLALPAAARPDRSASAVVLDRVQDPGNAGSVLRSAAALGVRQVLALKGTVALWSPKVLRAGMGAHFGLLLAEGLQAADLRALAPPLVATSPHAALELHQAPLPDPCAWVLGQEGQGLAPELAAACALTVRIPQPGQGESLNVAAAAAICLYEGLRRRLAAAPGQ